MKTMPKFALAALAAVCIVTEAQAMRWYSPNTGRWLSRDPVQEQGSQNLYAFVGNQPTTKVDFLGLYNWGEPGPFYVTQDKDDGWMRWTEKGDWLAKRPGDGLPCCEKPVQHTMNRTDAIVSMFHIPMSVDLHFKGGPHRELVLVWFTCKLPDHTANARVQCNNSTSCDIPTRPFGYYETWVRIAYLSCEDGYWRTKTGMKWRDYTAHGLVWPFAYWSWTGN
jgi:hypothetical protein